MHRQKHILKYACCRNNSVKPTNGSFWILSAKIALTLLDIYIYKNTIYRYLYIYSIDIYSNPQKIEKSFTSIEVVRILLLVVKLLYMYSIYIYDIWYDTWTIFEYLSNPPILSPCQSSWGTVFWGVEMSKCHSGYDSWFSCEVQVWSSLGSEKNCCAQSKLKNGSE